LILVFNSGIVPDGGVLGTNRHRQWQRIVYIQQRTAVEKKLREQFPPRGLAEKKGVGLMKWWT
jgi:hypothetical protein